jgi:8-oxo-dGTP diphosphatase
VDKKSAHLPIRVVAGLIFRDKQILICQRRATAAFALKWEFPGGKVENDEGDLDALRRELKEELAIDVRAAELFRRYEHTYQAGPTVTLHFYRVRNFEGDPKNLVFQQMLWVDVVELKDFDFLDGDRRLIEQIAGQEPV